MEYPEFINPIAISIPIAGFWGDSIDIAWYGISYVLGAYLVYWHMVTNRFQFGIDLDKNQTEDLVFFYGLFLGAVVGGRLGSVLFYDLHLQLQDPFYVFKIWQGGMSFHGGLIGIIATSFWFAKKNNQNPFSYLDIVSIVAPIGIFFSR